MTRENRHTVEQPKTWTERRREANSDCRGVFRNDRERLALHLKRVREQTLRPLVVDRVERKDNVVGRKGSAVRESQPATQREPIRAAVRQHLPALGELG